MSAPYGYTVLLEVRLTGPDLEWRDVADALVAEVAELELEGLGVHVTDAALDEASEEAER